DVCSSDLPTSRPHRPKRRSHDRPRHARRILQVLRPLLPHGDGHHRRRLHLLALQQGAVRGSGQEHHRRRGQAMSVGEHDPYTGQRMTGHEWNGIKELNIPVPKTVWFFLSVTALFAFAYWVLMPAWPLGVTYTKGLLGIDQREIVRESVAEAARQ